MEEFNIQKIRHLLPDGIDEDLLSDLYRLTCETKQEMQGKVPANAVLAEVEQFKQLIDRLRPYLQNGFSSARVEEQMAREAELIGLDGEPDGNGDNYDVQEDRQIAMAALDRLHRLAGSAATELDHGKKGRPPMTDRNVLLYRLYDHLLKCGCKDGEAKIRAGQIMMVWGLPVPGYGSDARTAIKNITKATESGRWAIEEHDAFESGDYAFG